MLVVAFHTHERRMAFIDYKKIKWRIDKNKFVKVNKPLKLGNTKMKISRDKILDLNIQFKSKIHDTIESMTLKLFSAKNAVFAHF